MNTAIKDLILAIDCGTQSVRALIFDLQGQLLQKSRVPIEPYFSTAPAWPSRIPRFSGRPYAVLPAALVAHRFLVSRFIPGPPGRCGANYPALDYDQPG